MTTTAIPAADTGLPQMNRRALLRAAPLAAAMAAAPAMALGSAPAAPDPAIEAIAAWEQAWRAPWGAGRPIQDDESPEREAVLDAADEAHTAACRTVATTAAGLVAQLRFAYSVFGESIDINARGYTYGEPYSDPEAYDFGDWTNRRDAALLANMLACALTLAERPPLTHR